MFLYVLVEDIKDNYSTTLMFLIDIIEIYGMLLNSSNLFLTFLNDLIRTMIIWQTLSLSTCP